MIDKLNAICEQAMRRPVLPDDDLIRHGLNANRALKIIKPGQAIQLMVDGQLYTGQKTINGRTLRLVRKNGILVLEADGQALAEVEGFF